MSKKGRIRNVNWDPIRKTCISIKSITVVNKFIIHVAETTKLQR